MPDEPKIEEQPNTPTPEEEEKKRQEEEEIRKLAKANKEEEGKLEKLKQDLAAKRKERKELQSQLGNDPEPEEKDDLDTALDKKLQEREKRDREARLVGMIKKTAKTKQEAEEIFSQLSKFESTGSDELDVKFALERAEAIRNQGGSFNTPSFSDADFTDVEGRQEDPDGISPESKEYLKSQGLNDDDIKKFKDGMDLTRVFPKVISEPLSKPNN